MAVPMSRRGTLYLSEGSVSMAEQFRVVAAARRYWHRHYGSMLNLTYVEYSTAFWNGYLTARNDDLLIQINEPAKGVVAEVCVG